MPQDCRVILLGGTESHQVGRIGGRGSPDADRVRTLSTLVGEGYTSQIHLGHDAACFYDFMVGDPNFADEKPGYLHISQHILPALLEAGVTEAQIDEMMIANPASFFA